MIDRLNKRIIDLWNKILIHRDSDGKIDRQFNIDIHLCIGISTDIDRFLYY